VLEFGWKNNSFLVLLKTRWWRNDTFSVDQK
jgi:hypothetical protein